MHLQKNKVSVYLENCSFLNYNSSNLIFLISEISKNYYFYKVLIKNTCLRLFLPINWKCWNEIVAFYYLFIFSFFLKK